MPPELDEYNGYYITVSEGRFKLEGTGFIDGYRGIVWDEDGRERRVYVAGKKETIYRWAKDSIDRGLPPSMRREQECVLELIAHKDVPTEDTYEVD